MFYECEDSDIENFADNTIPYSWASDTDAVIFELQITTSELFTWLNNNHIKANLEKSHLLLISKTPKKTFFGGALVESSSTKKLLGI